MKYNEKDCGVLTEVQLVDISDSGPLHLFLIFTFSVSILTRFLI
jgi:hypothetical protein